MPRTSDHELANQASAGITDIGTGPLLGGQAFNNLSAFGSNNPGLRQWIMQVQARALKRFDRNRGELHG